MGSDKIVVPYTNGIDDQVKGYVDLTKMITDISDQVIKERNMKKIKSFRITEANAKRLASLAKDLDLNQ
ncbi:hypothetical protein LCGC14_2975250, partial [marine sediment metagenome]